MDTTLVPLRPGLVMINPVRTPLEPGQAEIFKRVGRRRAVSVVAAEIRRCDADDDL